MQVTSETLTETERNTLFVTIHGYEFRLWFNQLNFSGQFGWQVDIKETDGDWSYHSCAHSLTAAFNLVRVTVDL